MENTLEIHWNNSIYMENTLKPDKKYFSGEFLYIGEI